MPSSPCEAAEPLAFGAPARRQTAWLGQWTYAHRGLHGAGVPENSPSAFAGAIARGLGIECDVQRSADGQAMVFHDWELDRMTSEHGPVAARNATELAAIALQGSMDRIPSLAALLRQVGGQVPLLIEVKSRRSLDIAGICAAVARDLSDYGGLHAVMSFDPRVCRWFSRHAPEVVRGLVVTEEHDRGLVGSAKRHVAFWTSGADFLAYDLRDLPSRFPAVKRRRGVPVLTWTVRSPELAARAEMYADAAIAEGAGVQEAPRA